jgi:hypothetical protein
MRLARSDAAEVSPSTFFQYLPTKGGDRALRRLDPVFSEAFVYVDRSISQLEEHTVFSCEADLPARHLSPSSGYT